MDGNFTQSCCFFFPGKMVDFEDVSEVVTASVMKVKAVRLISNLKAAKIVLFLQCLVESAEMTKPSVSLVF